MASGSDPPTRPPLPAQSTDRLWRRAPAGPALQALGAYRNPDGGFGPALEPDVRDLDRLEAGQGEDGGWTFDWLGWSPGQAVEWRGIVTLEALSLLLAHGRIERPGHRAGAPDGP